MRWVLAFVAMLAIVVTARSAVGSQWQVQHADSRLGFVATWEDTAFEGVFHNFKADISFDPAEPTVASFNVTVDVTSADTNNRDRDQAMGEPDWFNFSAYPQATFISHSVRATGGSRFEIDGILNIKGIERNFQLPFTWKQEGGRVRMQSEATLTRTDYAIGEGEWAAGDVIGLEVRVVVDLVLRPVKPSARLTPPIASALPR